MMSQSDPRLERTRRKVLAAAQELLQELGFSGVTIDHISDRSGVARSTIYRHWNTKEEILRDAFSALAVPAANGADSLREDLRRYARALTSGLQDTWGRAAASIAISALDDPAQAKVILTFWGGISADIRELLKRARARGEPVRRANADDVAEHLVSVFFYRYLFSHRPLDDRFAEQQADRVFQSLSTQHHNTNSDRSAPSREA